MGTVSPKLTDKYLRDKQRRAIHRAKMKARSQELRGDQYVPDLRSDAVALDPLQIEVAECFAANMTTSEVSLAHGISMKTLQKWRRHPLFKAYEQEIALEHWNDAVRKSRLRVLDMVDLSHDVIERDLKDSSNRQLQSKTAMRYVEKILPRANPMQLETVAPTHNLEALNLDEKKELMQTMTKMEIIPASLEN